MDWRHLYDFSSSWWTYVVCRAGGKILLKSSGKTDRFFLCKVNLLEYSISSKFRWIVSSICAEKSTVSSTSNRDGEYSSSRNKKRKPIHIPLFNHLTHTTSCDFSYGWLWHFRLSQQQTTLRHVHHTTHHTHTHSTSHSSHIHIHAFPLYTNTS
jgi:hypothetical protein